MRFLVYALAAFLLVAATGVGASGSSGATFDFQWLDGEGYLTISGANGSEYEIHDALGNFITNGVVPADVFTVPVGEVTTDEDGVVLYVTLDHGDEVAVMDPDWLWD